VREKEAANGGDGSIEERQEEKEWIARWFVLLSLFLSMHERDRGSSHA
jgi:hypothetical protein